MNKSLPVLPFQLTDASQRVENQEDEGVGFAVEKPKEEEEKAKPAEEESKEEKKVKVNQ